MRVFFEEQRDKYKTNLILGIDPKNEDELENFLKLFTDKEFLKELKNKIIGIKPNLKFYQSEAKQKKLNEIFQIFSDKYILLDAKCSDGFHTEKNLIENYKNKISGITIAPSSGDDSSFIRYGKENNIDIYGMGVMSFCGVIRLMIENGYSQNIQTIKKNITEGITGLVIGATTNNPNVAKEVQNIKNKIKNGDIEFEGLKEYSEQELTKGIEKRNHFFKELFTFIATKNIKVLTPGFGRQGGNIENYFLSKIISYNNHLINIGSNLFTDKPTKNEILTRIENFRKAINYYTFSQ